MRISLTISVLAVLLLGACDQTSRPVSTTLTQTQTQTQTTSREGSSTSTTTNLPSTSTTLVDMPEALGDSDELSAFLHGAGNFGSRDAGRRTIAVPIGFNQNRLVVVRTPDGYDPTEPWPLIVAYHVWGGSADQILNRVELLLGDAIDDYVIAAPDDYRQTILDAPPPVTSEHVSVWREVKRRWHIDADRTYVLGYSLGGETTMTMATLHPGEFAGAVAMAAGYSFPSDVDGLWDAFLPNLGEVPVLHVWGADDHLNIPGLNGRPSNDTLTAQNERLDAMLGPLGLDLYRHIRLDGVGHSNVYPETDLLLTYLTAERRALPMEINHTFRYIHQANAYWIEGHEWAGEAWIDTWPNIDARSGESDEAALNRTIFELLGRITASIDDNTIRVDATHLADLTVWISGGMIDWKRPVTVEFSGEEVFSDMIERDVAVAVSQAARTLDYDRLRWAGIRINAATGMAHTVTPSEPFPPILREITID